MNRRLLALFLTAILTISVSMLPAPQRHAAGNAVSAASPTDEEAGASTTNSMPAHTLLGRTIADFTLRDTHGQARSLGELAGKKAVVVVFVGCSCPLAQLYAPRLADLAREFAPRGVAFVAINSNAQDSLADVASHARRHQFPFPLLKDPDHAVADSMGAVRTPEAFVLDERRVVRYWGRIDDQYSIGVQRPRPMRRDLAEALHELLAARPVSRPVAPASGCHIGRLPRNVTEGEAKSEVTYAKHVSRILQKRCLECHRSGEIAPFPLTEYKDVVPWSAMIREVVEEGRMPPWSADVRFGHFRNDARLTAEEKSQLLRWIDNGCPHGDGADLPTAPQWTQGWRIARPDRVLHMSEQPFSVPAEGEVQYQYFLVDPGFREDKYLQAVEVRPGNRTVVHHALVSILPPGEKAMQGDTSGALLDYAPGMPPTVLPEGMAIHVPAGSKFLFQVHYTPNGTTQQDRSYMGLVFADPGRVKKRVRGGAVINQGIDIPPGAANHRETGEQVLAEDIVLLSLSPHLHLRGTAFRYEAIYPSGQREILLDVPRYDFNWQLRYDLAEPKLLPRGTRLICTARYDNSSRNPANPDPTQAVGWGDQTWEEMLIGFYAYVVN